MTGCWVSPVEHDRTRPVTKNHLWNLTRNDRTTSDGASGHNLNALMTIEIEQSTFEIGETWQNLRTGRWGPASGQFDRRVRSLRFLSEQRANGSIRGGSLFKPHG